MSDSKRNVHVSVDLITVAMFVFAVLKVAHVIDVSWWIILFPLTFWLIVIAIILGGGLALVGVSGMLDMYSRYRQKLRAKKNGNRYF